MSVKLFSFLFTLVFFSASDYLVAVSFPLADPGSEQIVKYKKYGTFENVGTDTYEYKVYEHKKLKDAVGEGVYPNTQSIYTDPEYKRVNALGLLNANQWEYINSDNYQLNFYKWATTQEEPGIKLYYTALALEKAGHVAHAIKAYYAIVVHFPRSVGNTYWGTPWYVGPVAIDKIKYLTTEHPEVGVYIKGASIKVKNRFDDDIKNDVFIVNPGALVKGNSKKKKKQKINMAKMKIIKSTEGKRVKLVQYANKHWQLLVDEKPYSIRGIIYSPNMLPLSPHYPTPEGRTLNVSRDWMYEDSNKNGIIDGPYEAWIDENKNNVKDVNENTIGDFQVMKDLGINTIRLYDHDRLNKKLLMEGYQKYGFMYVIGDMIGMYGQGSGAEWYYGTDYTNSTHQKNMLASIRSMVEEYRNEPYILMWVLGNENNYASPGEKGKFEGHGCRAKLQPEAYYAFVNKAARLIKSLDPQKRPVAICNGDTLFLDHCAKQAPDLDVFGANAYRGEQGFGSLWQDVADSYDKPVLITEYGCSAFHRSWTQEKSDLGQAKYLTGNWRDLEDNFGGSGVGNALGGFLFEWVDEWWKGGPATDPSKHDTTSQFGAPFLDGFSYEEWFGLCSQGDGSDSPFLRQLRPAFYDLKDAWQKYK